jgi:hypothetical protein
MTEKVIIWYECHSCENCHFGQREQYGKIRCKEDTSVVFTQNRDMGVPEGCPFRKRSVLQCPI